MSKKSRTTRTSRNSMKSRKSRTPSKDYHEEKKLKKCLKDTKIDIIIQNKDETGQGLDLRFFLYIYLLMLHYLTSRQSELTESALNFLGTIL